MSDIVERYVVESEGDWTRRVKDTYTGAYILRVLPPFMAESAAWAWNQLANDRHLASIDSRFQVSPVEGHTDFYDGSLPRAVHKA